MSVVGFAAVPNWLVRDGSVSLYAIAVYTALASHSGPGGIHPSQQVLAKESRCSERQVRNALNELETLGVIERVRRRRGEGRSTTMTNGYLLHPNGHLGADEEKVKPAAPPAASPERLTAHSDEANGTNVHVTPYIEEEPLKKNPQGGTRVSDSRGSRIPKNFTVTDEMRAWAATEVPLVDVDRNLPEFIDYWSGVPGSRGVKIDWVATWRNSMRKKQEFAVRDGVRPRQRMQTVADLAEKRRQMREEPPGLPAQNLRPLERR